MSRDPVVHEGETYLSIEVVAEIYALRSIVLREVYDRGLLGPGLTRGSTVCIATAEFDRVATIARMHLIYELDVDAIAARLA